MKPQGRIFREAGRLIIDADPHVMMRIRQLFDNSTQRHQGFGLHTHNPVSLSDTKATAKDLIWICDRYPLAVEPDLWSELIAGAAEYDAILAATADAHLDTSFRLSPMALTMAPGGI